jgi:hypothetical protein
VPEQLPPWFWDRAAKLLAEPKYVHTDSCSWTGADFPHPCTCRVPDLLRAVAERVGDITGSNLDLERAFDYLGRVPPEQPEPLPDATVIPRGPKSGTTRQWLTVWKPVRIRLRGTWRIGIVKNQVQQADGTWILLVEHASDGMHKDWPAAVWVVHDERLIRPVDAEPPSP